MQSSSSVLFRALVMLFCLVAIPLAALFGNALPGIARSALGGRWPQSWTAAGVTGPMGSEAPRFETPRNTSASTSSESGTAPPWRGEAGRDTAAWPVDRAPLNGSGVVPVGYEAGAGQAGPMAVAPENWAASQGLPGVEPLPAAVPAAGGCMPGGDGRATEGQPAADHFSYIQQRLRELGATYYLLETWGNQGMYRFYCRMAIGGNPNFTRHFESTGGNPLEAMGQVLRQVEAWRVEGR